ncbi:MAG: glycosyltransferase family 4 protein [Flavobacteriales bacterium]|nr:glycosyltransferase family 4 protein [Flavobacteriales bacterium]
MRKVLVICYYWPPASGPGVQRFLKMTKYFKDLGWRPYILTSKNGTYPVMDPSLEKEVPDDLEVHRTVPKELFWLYNKLLGKKGRGVSVGFIGMDQKNPLQRLAMYVRANFFIPDARKGWNKTAIPKAIELHEKENFDAIITTGPPHSSHLIGLELKKRTGVKWLVDLRDPWVNVYYNKVFPRTKKTKRKDLALETEVLTKADAVSVVSPGQKKEFEDRSKKIAVVYNGYEESDMKVSGQRTDTNFVISYIGSFLPSQNVKLFWEALSEVCNEDEEFRSKLQIQLTGNIHPAIIESIEQNKLKEHLNLSGFVSHEEAVRRMKDSDLLLFVIPDTEDNEYILPGKLFEYLASETPLVSIGPVNGDAAMILDECGRKPMMDHSDKASMKESILMRDANGVNPKYKAFTRKEQAKKLLSLLD